MNVKIKADGVVNVLGKDYDRIYLSLKERLKNPDEQIFTERTPGHEYLQWDLPDEDWTALSKADPLMEAQVRTELENRKKKVMSYFGNNLIMAQKILSVPDDSYVYFRIDKAGLLDIKLTAWGYKFPERVGSGAAIGYEENQVIKVPLKIVVISDGSPVAKKELYVNNMRRYTNDNGEYPVGDLPVGFQFELKVDDQQLIVTARQGEEEILIDITPPAPIVEPVEEKEEKIEEEIKPEEEETKDEEVEESKDDDPEEIPPLPPTPPLPPVPEPEKKHNVLLDILGILALLIMIAGAYIWGYYILF